MAGAGAATVVVDIKCPTNGNGTGGYTATCDGTAAGNPANTISGGITALASGDTLEVRGIHAAHGSCPGDTRGVHQNDEIQVQGKTNVTLQGYLYGQVGAERPFMEGVGDVTWTQCSWDGMACDCSPSTQNVQIGAGGSTACTETYYCVGVYPQSLALSCAKADGTPCFRVAAKSDMTNATAGYVGTVCSTNTWIKCNAASDCPGTGETCGGSSTEVDSWSSENASGTILARWGALSRGPVLFDNNGNAFWMCNSTGVTIRGFTFRDIRRNQILATNTGNNSCSGTSDNITITDNVFLYGIDTGGSDYGIGLFASVTTASVTGNYAAYMGSEFLHAEAPDAGVLALTAQRNFVRDSGDPNVLGTRGGYPNNGTPEAMIIGTDSGNGDYTNTDISDNYFLRMKKNCMILENGISNAKIHDNIMINCGRSGIKFAGTSAVNINSNQVYNNLIMDFCQSSTDDGGIWLQKSSTGGLDANKLYNNTVITSKLCPTLRAKDATGPTNMEIRNNIFDGTVATLLVDWTNAAVSNIFQYNLATFASSVTPPNPAVTWLNTARACAAISAAGTGNINNCPDPAFVNAAVKDFHIQTASPAKNAGTTSLAARTADINNSVASAFGLPSYSDANTIKGAAWDMGADEYSANVQDGGFELVSSQWTLTFEDCDQQGAFINTDPSFVQLGGAKSLGINSRVFGGQTICGVATQVVSGLEVDSEYAIAGFYKTNSNVTTQTFNVQIDGTTLDTLGSGSSSFTAFETQKFMATATSHSISLRFRATGTSSKTYYFDNIKLR